MSTKFDQYLQLADEITQFYTLKTDCFYLFSIRDTGLINNQNTVHNHLGHSLDQFELRITKDAVNHIEKRHCLRGPPEKLIQASDFALIDRLILENDRLLPGNEDKKNGMKRLVFSKNLAGVTYELITQIHQRRKYLSVITYYRV